MPKSSKPPRKTTTKAKPKPPTCLEQRFVLLWEETAKDSPLLKTLMREVMIPPRRYRFDFMVPQTNIFVEVNGGTWHGRRLGHSSPQGIMRDYQKSNYIQMRGYQLFTFDTKMVNESEVRQLYDYICKRYPDLV